MSHYCAQDHHEICHLSPAGSGNNSCAGRVKKMCSIPKGSKWWQFENHLFYEVRSLKDDYQVKVIILNFFLNDIFVSLISPFPHCKTEYFEIYLNLLKHIILNINKTNRIHLNLLQLFAYYYNLQKPPETKLIKSRKSGKDPPDQHLKIKKSKFQNLDFLIKGGFPNVNVDFRCFSWTKIKLVLKWFLGYFMCFKIFFPKGSS